MTLIYANDYKMHDGQAVRAWITRSATNADKAYIELRGADRNDWNTVELDREQATEWIKALTEIRDELPKLERVAPEGVTKVQDNDGDEWLLDEDGLWDCPTLAGLGPRSFDELLNEFGPLVPVGELIEC